ncbi:MAG: CDP-alcohol phosphatidyltransferase family protein [Pseudomonadota bacterium]
MRWLPNGISLLRIALVFPTIGSLLRDEYPAALLLVVVASISDALDGFLARRFQWTSRLGSFLDPIADKLLVAGLYLTLTFLEALPLWLLAVVLLRDVVIVAGAAAYRFVVGPLVMAPTRLSKLNTGLQFSLVVSVLVMLAFPTLEALEAILNPWAFVLVASTSLLSGAQYVINWSARARALRRGSADSRSPANGAH